MGKEKQFQQLKTRDDGRGEECIHMLRAGRSHCQNFPANPIRPVRIGHNHPLSLGIVFLARDSTATMLDMQRWVAARHLQCGQHRTFCAV